MGKESNKLLNSIKSFFGGFESNVLTGQQYHNASDLVRGQIRKVRMAKVPVLSRADIYEMDKEDSAEKNLAEMKRRAETLFCEVIPDLGQGKGNKQITEQELAFFTGEMNAIRKRMDEFRRKVNHSAELRYEESKRNLPAYINEGKQLMVDLKSFETKLKEGPMKVDELDDLGRRKNTEGIGNKHREEKRENGLSIEGQDAEKDAIHREIRKMIEEALAEEKRLKKIYSEQQEASRPFTEFMKLHDDSDNQYTVIARDMPKVEKIPGVFSDFQKLEKQWMDAYGLAERQILHAEQVENQIKEKIERWEIIRKEALLVRDCLLSQNGKNNRDELRKKKKEENASTKISNIWEQTGRAIRILEEKNRQLMITNERVEDRAEEEKKRIYSQYMTIKPLKNRYIDQRTSIKYEGYYNSLQELLKYPFCMDNVKGFPDKELMNLTMDEYREKNNREFISRKKKELAVYFRNIEDRELDDREQTALLTDEVIEEIHVESLKECYAMERAKMAYLTEKVGVDPSAVLNLPENIDEAYAKIMDTFDEYEYVFIHEFKEEKERNQENYYTDLNRRKMYDVLIRMNAKYVLFLAYDQPSIWVEELQKKGIRIDEFRKSIEI